MKFISSLILCLAPITFFANDPIVGICEKKDPLQFVSENLKTGFRLLKQEDPKEAAAHFQHVINTCQNKTFAHKHSILLTATYGWAIALDQIDQLDELYKFIGKSFCDFLQFSVSEPDFDYIAYTEEVMDLIFDDEMDELMDQLVDIDSQDFAKLQLKAKDNMIKKLLELSSTPEE